MSQIRVKQIESGELFSFVDSVFSGEIGSLGDNVDFLLSFTSGISGYADDLSDKIDLLSGQVIDLTDSFTGIDARLDIVSGMMNDLNVYTNELSGYIDLVSGIAFSFSGLAHDAYTLSQTTADGLFNTGIIINIISGKVDSLSGSLVYISGTARTTEIDFGTGLYQTSKVFTVTDASVTTGSIINGSVAYVAPTSKSLDDIEMDTLLLSFAPGAGSVSILAKSREGSVHDKFKVFYKIN